MTFTQITRIWLTGRSPRTVQVYHPFIEDMEARSQKLFEKSLLDLSAPELEGLLRERNVGCSPVTEARHLFQVRGFFQTVIKLGVRKDNPAAELKPPKFEDKLADRLLNLDQVKTLLAAAESERDRLLVRTLYGAGLRISEALNLKKKDLMGNGMIRVWGKGQRTDYVKIQPELEADLLKFAAKQPGEHVFQSHIGPLTRAGAYFIIKNIARRAGMPQVSAHFFRHAHATIALQNRAPLHVVQKSLRHRSIETTMRYTHVMPGEGASNFLPAL